MSGEPTFDSSPSSSEVTVDTSNTASTEVANFPIAEQEQVSNTDINDLENYDVYSIDSIEQLQNDRETLFDLATENEDRISEAERSIEQTKKEINTEEENSNRIQTITNELSNIGEDSFEPADFNTYKEAIKRLPDSYNQKEWAITTYKRAVDVAKKRGSAKRKERKAMKNDCTIMKSILIKTNDSDLINSKTKLEELNNNQINSEYQLKQAQERKSLIQRRENLIDERIRRLQEDKDFKDQMRLTGTVENFGKIMEKRFPNDPKQSQKKSLAKGIAMQAKLEDGITMTKTLSELQNDLDIARQSNEDTSELAENLRAQTKLDSEFWRMNPYIDIANTETGEIVSAEEFLLAYKEAQEFIEDLPSWEERKGAALQTYDKTTGRVYPKVGFQHGVIPDQVAESHTYTKEALDFINPRYGGDMSKVFEYNEETRNLSNKERVRKAAYILALSEHQIPGHASPTGIRMQREVSRMLDTGYYLGSQRDDLTAKNSKAFSDAFARQEFLQQALG